MELSNNLLESSIFTYFSRCFCSESKASATDVFVAKAKRQLQMFFVAKAKRQLQLCRGIIDCEAC